MINVIPMPNGITVKEGDCFLYRSRLLIRADRQLSEIAPLVSKYLNAETIITEAEPHVDFIFDDTLGEETYSLVAESYRVKIFAGTYSGAFYGLMTLRQLFLADTVKGETLTCQQVEILHDQPKYDWRGLQLDESRHFFGKETVKKYLDFMALYKLNRFHWHLTDDQGWRIEIEKYPLLTEVGSYRDGSQLHAWNCTEYDATAHYGYYTKEDIREIVAYAKARCIEIVPEIDFPAHCAAAIAAYNNLACREIESKVFDFCGDALAKEKGIKNWNRPLCLGKDEVITFATDVIDEVAELFPFEYFHVGGDEAPTNEWKKCPHCQKRIKDNKLKNEVNLQAWFTNRINSHLIKKGKIMIGWNEVLASKITNTDVVAQYWTPKSDKNVIKHLKNGGKVILSNHKSFYFDMSYSYCTPKGTYFYKPEKVKIKKELLNGVLGVEGEMWTEWVPHEDHLFFMIFNRALALSENAWTYRKDYKHFKYRLQKHKKMMDAMDIFYGSDKITMHKSKSFKKRTAKKNGFSIKHLDAEYRIDGIYDEAIRREAEERKREKELRAIEAEKSKNIGESIDEVIIKVAEFITSE